MLATRATIGRIVNRVCPRCRGELAAGGDVLYCTEIPCYVDHDEQYTEPLPEDLRLRDMGAEPLPGLD